EYLYSDIDYQVVSALNDQEINQASVHMMSTESSNLGRVIEDDLSQITYQVTTIISFDGQLSDTYYMDINQMKHNVAVSKYSQSYAILTDDQIETLLDHHYSVISIRNQAVDDIKNNQEISYQNIGILHWILTSAIVILMTMTVNILANEDKYRKLRFLGLTNTRIYKIYIAEHAQIGIALISGYMMGLVSIYLLNYFSIIDYQMLSVRIPANLIVLGILCIGLSIIYLCSFINILVRKHR
ncbi:MAG: hypothetical protein WCR19_06860, partial [Acholeplasmataceae bacterium]